MIPQSPRTDTGTLNLHDRSHIVVCVPVLILDARQKRAEELRRLTDQSASMSEEQLTELRAEIKACERARVEKAPV